MLGVPRLKARRGYPIYAAAQDEPDAGSVAALILEG